VVIHNFNVEGVPYPPFKANTPLVIDPNAVLALPAPVQGFQMVCRRDPQIVQGNSPAYHSELPKGCLLNVVGQPMGESPVKNELGFLVLEVPDHASRV
jgi:hypothetical protein